MCVLANLEYLSILFCAVFWAAAPGLVAVLPMNIIIVPWSQKITSRALNDIKNKINDSVTQVKNRRSTDCQRSNERLKSSLLSRRLKAISDGDVMT